MKKNAEVVPLPKQPPKVIRSEPVWVTPELAKEWLKKNHPENRPISWVTVESFANDMSAGNWQLTHQGICFGRDGLLIDGQHRLEAVIHSKTSVWINVSWDDSATFKGPIDVGRSRSLALIMKRRARDVACLNVLRWFEAGYELHPKMTLAEAEELLMHHSGALEQVHGVPGANRLFGPTLAACVWALPCAGKKTLEFATKVATGEMIGRGNPAFSFRNWLERNKRAGSWEKACAALNALRYYAHDMKIGSIYTGDSGYRAVVAKRRALRVPFTPGTDLVVGVSWPPGRGEAEQ